MTTAVPQFETRLSNIRNKAGERKYSSLLQLYKNQKALENDMCQVYIQDYIKQFQGQDKVNAMKDILKARRLILRNQRLNK